MAELPPLSPYPESPLTPEFIGQLEHSANWARRFGSADVNIAQRARHNQDIEAYAGALKQQREMEQERLLMTNKRAQDYAFGVQRLDLQEREANARMRHAEEMQPLKIQAQEAGIRASLARERAAIQADNLKQKALEQEDADTEAFHKALNDGLASGVKIGTPEWSEVITRARLASPAMKSEIFDDTWKATSRSPLSPQEALDNAVAKERGIQQVRQEFRQTKAEKPDSYADFNKDLEAAKKAYESTGLPPFIQRAFEERGSKLEEAAKGAPAKEQPAAPSAQTSESESASTTLKEMGFLTDKNDLKSAIRRYQIRTGLEVTGDLNDETQKALGINAATSAQKFTPIKTDKDSFSPRNVRDEISPYEATSNAYSNKIEEKDPEALALRREYFKNYGETDPHGASLPRWLATEKGWGPQADQPNQPVFDPKSADDVKAAFKAGSIPREEALKLLKEKFNHS